MAEQTLDFEQMRRQTNRYFLDLLWLTTLLGIGPFVAAAYFKLIPIPFGPMVTWFAIYLVLYLPYTVLVLTGRRPALAGWLISPAMALAWALLPALVPLARDIWGIWLIAPIYSIVFLDNKLTAVTTAVTVVLAVTDNFLLPPQPVPADGMLVLSLANLAIIISNSLAILQCLGRINQVLQALRRAAGEGARQVEANLASANAIQASLDRISQTMAELDRRSGQIGEVVTAVREIANQTNLLALNAAIEAARARP